VDTFQLPIKIDIIKHRQEVHGKSTSSHARMIAPDYCKIYEYPDIPDYSAEHEDVVLIFPSTKSVSISSLFKGVSTSDFIENQGLESGFHVGTMQKKNLDDILSDEGRDKLTADDEKPKQYTLENLPFKRAVFIDSTWKQCRGIYKDPRINSLKSCIIQNRITKFWRTQKGAPKWYLSTIEAIHQFLLEVHINAWGISQSYYNDCLEDLQLDASFIPPSMVFESSENNQNSLCEPYSGQYDNLLYFFSFLYSLIHSLDNANGKLNILDHKFEKSVDIGIE
jgi:DTW domain